MTHASNEGEYLGAVTLDGDDRPWPLSEIVEIDELAAMLGIKPGTIRQHINAGTGRSWLPRPAGKVAGAWVYIRSQLDLAAIQAARVPRGKHAPKPTDTAATASPAPEAATVEPPAEPADDGWWDPSS